MSKPMPTPVSKPTPGPWRDAGEDGIGGVEFIGIEAGEEGGPTYRRVAWVMSNGGPDYNHLSAEDRANAAHLIKCVNMHDELVSALKGLFELIEQQDLVRNTQSDAEFIKFFDQSTRIVAALKLAGDVLVKAEGRDE